MSFAMFSVEGSGLIASLARMYMFFIKMFSVEYNSIAFKFRTKRVCIFLLISVLIPILSIWNHIGLYLDELFYPDWKEETIDYPLFLVGNARSGTTWLHRLICQNDEIFVTFKTWEILFAISITWRKLFFLLYNIDFFLFNGLILKMVLSMEKMVVGNIKVHPIGLFEAEEDEWIMIHFGFAQLILLLFPEGTSIFGELILFDFPENEQVKLSSKLRKKIFSIYKTCVQKHVYYYSRYNDKIKLKNINNEKRNVIFVSKNPTFTLRLETLYLTFSNARVVCLLRDPVQSVPSMISYISKVWHVFAQPNEKYPSADQLLSFCEAHYLYPLKHLNSSARGPDTWCFISYHNVLKDLENEVINMLIRLFSEFKKTKSDNVSGIEGIMSNSMRTFLQHEQLRANCYKTSHSHSIAQCCGGMTENQLRDKLITVYKEHFWAFPK